MSMFSVLVARALRGIWRELSGYNAMRRKRIDRKRMIRELDESERELEALIDGSSGRERVGYVNDLFWLRSQRVIFGVTGK